MKIKTFLTTAAATALLSTAAFAGNITVTDAWARASAGMAKAGGAFMTIKNAGAADTLVKADADVAPRIELHTHIMDNGVMKMREVEGGIPVPAGGMQMLQPGGYHVMFMGLNAPLKEGSSFPLTLTFKSGESVTVDVQVMSPSAMGAMNGAMNGAKGHGHGAMGQGNMSQAPQEHGGKAAEHGGKAMQNMGE